MPPAKNVESDALRTDGLLSRRQLSAACAVHMMTVTKWEREGMPCAARGGPGRPSFYRLEDVRAWRTKQEEAAKSNSPFADAHKARAMKDTAQAKLAEQRFLLLQGELLPRADVERVWNAEISAVRAKLLSIPMSFADRVARAATIDGIAGVERVLDDAVREVLRELSNPEREIPEESVPA